MKNHERKARVMLPKDRSKYMPDISIDFMRNLVEEKMVSLLHTKSCIHGIAYTYNDVSVRNQRLVTTTSTYPNIETFHLMVRVSFN